MKRFAVYLDISNLYYCVKEAFNAKISYNDYLKFIEPMGNIIIKKAYGAQMKDEASKFIIALETLGFETIYKKPKTFYNEEKVQHKADHDVEISIDMIKDMEHYDVAILGTADGDLTPTVKYLKEHGKEVIVFACNISHDLKDMTTCISIPESLCRKVQRRKK